MWCCSFSPFHNNEETFLPMVHVLIEAEYPYDVGTSGRSPVQLHFPSGFGSVVENLLNVTKCFKHYNEMLQNANQCSRQAKLKALNYCCLLSSYSRRSNKSQDFKAALSTHAVSLKVHHCKREREGLRRVSCFSITCTRQTKSQQPWQCKLSAEGGRYHINIHCHSHNTTYFITSKEKTWRNWSDCPSCLIP